MNRTICTFTLKRKNIKEISLYIILLLFIKPACVEDLPLADFIFNAGRLGLSLIFIYRYIITKKITLSYVALFLVFLEIFIVTFINSGAIHKVITHFIPPLGLLSFLYSRKNRVLSIMEMLLKLCYILLLLNLITFLIFPNGLIFRESNQGSVWLLGQKQDLPGIIIPMIFFSIVVDIKKDTSWFFKTFLLCILAVLLEKSIAAFLCVLVFGILCLFDRIFHMRQGKYILLCFLISAFVILQYISSNFNDLSLLQNFLTNTNLGSVSKIRTLNVRFTMWEYAWMKFLSSPIFGVGELSYDVLVSEMGFYHSIFDNMYMDILMWGGVVSISLFLYMILMSFKKIGRLSKIRYARYLNYSLFSICLYMFTGSPFTTMVFLVLLASSWLPYFNIRVK